MKPSDFAEFPKDMRIGMTFETKATIEPDAVSIDFVLHVDGVEATACKGAVRFEARDLEAMTMNNVLDLLNQELRNEVNEAIVAGMKAVS